MLSLFLVACVAQDDARFQRAKAGNPQTDDGTPYVSEDTAETGAEGEDSPPTEDTAPPEDTGAQPDETCYLGPARDHSVCVPTVADDGSFGSAYDYPEPYDGSAQYAAPTRFIDLDALSPDLEIAPNFVLSEYAESYKGRWAVLQARMVDTLQALRDDLGGPLTITSGYRNPEYNASVGGVSSSRHQYGDAADLDASGWSVEDLGDVCYDEGASYVGLYEDGHTHCDWRDDPLDPAFYASSGGPPLPHEGATLRCGGGVCTAAAEGFDEGEPFRRWWAIDAEGRVIGTATGRSFVAPAGAARVRVRVGGRVEAETGA